MGSGSPNPAMMGMNNPNINTGIGGGMNPGINPGMGTAYGHGQPPQNIGNPSGPVQ